MTAALFALAACGCGVGGGRPATDLGVDAGVDAFAAPTDAGSHDAGPPVCEGTAPACALLAMSACGGIDGCAWTQCVGFPVSCALEGASSACTALAGCRWTGAGCTGEPAPCGSFDADAGCAAQAGCAWAPVPGCHGIATPCASYDAASCPRHPGCHPITPRGGDGPPDAGPPPVCAPDAAPPPPPGPGTCAPPATPASTGCDPVAGVECDGDWTGVDPRTAAPYCDPPCSGDACCSPRDGRFQCVPRHADGSCPLADLVVDGSHVDGMYSLERDALAADTCPALEDCVAAPGDRRLLRFDLWTKNAGDADVYLGPPPPDGTSAGIFTWSACELRHHVERYAEYELVSADGCCVAAAGHEPAICLADLERYDTARGSDVPVYDCTDQGVQRGYEEVYSSGLDCQWIDVTDVPPGDYWLHVRVNVGHAIAERDYDDDAWVPVHLPPG